MATTFHSEKVWTRIRQLLKHQKAGALVAVPFLAPNAAKQLPLRRGDVLVTRFDDAAIKRWSCRSEGSSEIHPAWRRSPFRRESAREGIRIWELGNCRLNKRVSIIRRAVDRGRLRDKR